MTNTGPHAAARPSEGRGAQARPTVSWWAAIDRPRARNVSPLCASFDAAARWLEAEARDDDEVSIWERTKHGSLPAEDVRVWPEDDELTPHDHLHVMTRRLAEKLTEARRGRDLPSTGRRGSGHVDRPAQSMDPSVRMLSYHEVYDDDGALIMDVDAQGYVVEPEAKR